MGSNEASAMIDEGSALPNGRFEGRLAFEELILKVFRQAAYNGWSEITLSDADFSAWPLNQRAVIDALSTWAVAGRKLTLLANRYDAVQRLQPRFVGWRRTWDHLVEARLCDEAAFGDVPSALWSPSWCFRLTDSVRQAGFCGTDRAMNVNLREVLAERLRTSELGFPASVLGL